MLFALLHKYLIMRVALIWIRFPTGYVTHGGNVSAISVVERMSLVGQKGGLLTGALSESAE